MVLRKEPWLSGSGVTKGLGVAAVTVTGHTERPYIYKAVMFPGDGWGGC